MAKQVGCEYNLTNLDSFVECLSQTDSVAFTQPLVGVSPQGFKLAPIPDDNLFFEGKDGRFLLQSSEISGKFNFNRYLKKSEILKIAEVSFS